MSHHWDGRWSCGASRSISWQAGLKAATPTCMSSSAATAATTPNWTTATSRLTFGGSAGHTRFRQAYRHTGDMSRFDIGSCRFLRANLTWRRRGNADGTKD